VLIWGGGERATPGHFWGWLQGQLPKGFTWGKKHPILGRTIFFLNMAVFGGLGRVPWWWWGVYIGWRGF
jgi:hypothetical protein